MISCDSCKIQIQNNTDKTRLTLEGKNHHSCMEDDARFQSKFGHLCPKCLIKFKIALVAAIDRIQLK